MDVPDPENTKTNMRPVPILKKLIQSHIASVSLKTSLVASKITVS